MHEHGNIRSNAETVLSGVEVIHSEDALKCTKVHL